MAIVTEEVAFEGQAPELSCVAAKVTELIGLPVSLSESDAEIKGDLFDSHGYLAFTAVPEAQITIHTYRAGAVRQLCEDAFGDTRLPFVQRVTGMNERAGTQTVYLRGYLGQEPTLFMATTIALEALGGRTREPLTEELRREYGSPLTADQLVERWRKMAGEMRAASCVGLLLLPLLVPLWLLGFLWFLLMLPWRLWKAYQITRSWMEGRGSSAGH